MKNKDLFDLRTGLGQVANLKGAKFAYAVAKNHKLINAEIESLQKGLQSDELKDLEAKEREIYKKYCRMDEAGEPIPDAKGNFDIPEENKKACDTALATLKEENKESYEAREAVVKDYNELLDEDSSVELFKIPESYLPEEISGAQTAQIFEIIK